MPQRLPIPSRANASCGRRRFRESPGDRREPWRWRIRGPRLSPPSTIRRCSPRIASWQSVRRSLLTIRGSRIAVMGRADASGSQGPTGDRCAGVDRQAGGGVAAWNAYAGNRVIIPVFCQREARADIRLQQGPAESSASLRKRTGLARQNRLRPHVSILYFGVVVVGFMPGLLQHRKCLGDTLKFNRHGW